MRVRFLDVGGIQTRVLHEGAGPPVLLIHGVGVSADSWLRNIDPLAEDFAVWAPDTLGHGFTGSGDYREGPPHPYLVDHLAQLVDRLELDHFVAVGSSLGALLAALLYFRMPDRVSKLVMISSGSALSSEDDLARTMREAYANGISAIADPTLASCRKRMENIFYDPAAVPSELIHIQLTMYALPGSREAYERRMRGMMDVIACRPYRIVDRLEQVALPTLMIWSKQDPRAKLADAE